MSRLEGVETSATVRITRDLNIQSEGDFTVKSGLNNYKLLVTYINYKDLDQIIIKLFLACLNLNGRNSLRLFL